MYLSFVAFALGIAFRSYVNLGWNFSLLILFLGLIFGIVAFLRSSIVLRTTCCLLLAVGIGMLRFDLADFRAPRGLDPYIGEHVTVTGVLRDEPLEKGQNLRLVLDVDGVVTMAEVGLPAGRSPTSTNPTRARVLARIPTYPAYQYGDRLLLSGTLAEPSNFSPDFDWVNYLKKDDIRYEMQKPRLELVAHGQGNPVVATALRVRHAFLAALQANLPEPESALGAGITIGENGNTIASLQETFRQVGLSHVVVVSGYNLSIVGNNIADALALLPRTLALFSGAVAVLFFVLLTGGGASVLRAAVMALVAILARSTGRLYEAFWALLLAGVLMLLWNPRLLIFDLSFELSFLATAGIIFLSPITEQWRFIRPLPNPKFFKTKEFATATSAALFAVAPLILAKIGNFSFVAIIVNVLVLPLVPISMAFTALAGGIGSYSHVLAFPFAAIAYTLLRIIIEIANLFAALPFASLQGVSFPWWLAVLCYTALIIYTVCHYRRTLNPSPQEAPPPSTLGDDFEIEEVE